MQQVRSRSYSVAFVRSVFRLGGDLVLLLTLTALTWGTGVAATPSRVWVLAAFISVVKGTWLYRLPSAVRNHAEATNTMARLQKFLMLDEVDESQLAYQKNRLKPKPEDCCITVTDATARWDTEAESVTLEGVSLEVKPGELVAVIGPVGAGKSSLLMAVLGELPLQSGQIKSVGQIAYASQQPWVFSATLRQNIVFGKDFNERKYQQVIRACALKRDLEILPEGDMTLVGERGVSLSGGQRARVSLARAMYSDADLYLLDDPLSAVDTHVGKHLFDKCVMQVLKKKPRILVTHQLQYLKVADRIVVLKEGQQLATGTFDELSRSGIDFTSLLHREDDEDEETIEEALAEHDESDPDKLSPSQIVSEMRRRSGSKTERQYIEVPRLEEGIMSDMGSSLSLRSLEIEVKPDFVPKREEEQRSAGTVGWKVYKEYFAAGANCFVIVCLVLLNILAQLAYVMSDWWLSYWSNQEEQRLWAVAERERILGDLPVNTTLPPNVTLPHVPYVPLDRNLGIFGALTASVFLFGLFRALLFFKVCVTASQNLHNRMFANIVRAPVYFYDTNPVGRVLNRFAKDVGQMDDMLPVTFFDFVQCTLLILGIVIVAGAVNPWVFIPVVPIIIVFFLLRKYFLATSRDIKRLEGTTRSPVFSHLSATLQGLHTVRAYGSQDIFITEFDTHQDLHTSAWFLFLTTTRWFAIRLDWLCAIFVTTVCFSALFSAGSLDAGMVGLTVTYAMALMGMFQWGVRQSAETENQMTSVERVLEYCNIAPEAALECDPPPPPSWPDKGAITAKDVSFRYAEKLPDVLKNLNFVIHSEEKIGVVGRTGAGKSSLIAMLFRLAEARGEVTIDGEDTAAMGLHQLRRNVAIIPQDPVLFTGTVRHNLDPFNQHSDKALWDSLQQVELRDAIEDLAGGLDCDIAEGGSNLSVGQRQLLCLARAILRRNKILIIDEATANVDPRTDELIQATIRTKFRSCTVLTIAHRLHTIMDSDRVMVMEDGHIAEFAAPHTLLQKPSEDGMFVRMVEQTGPAEEQKLRQMAHQAWQDRGGVGQEAQQEILSGSPDTPAVLVTDTAAAMLDDEPDVKPPEAGVTSEDDRKDSLMSSDLKIVEDGDSRRASQDTPDDAGKPRETPGDAGKPREAADDAEDCDEGTSLVPDVVVVNGHQDD